jgi:hypothetical protein
METKKDIGSAIKERMVDYKPQPDPKLWKTIQLNLELKNRKRVLIGWIYLSGVLLLILGISIILLTTNYLGTPKNNQIAIPETDNIDWNNPNSKETINDLKVTTNSNQKEIKDSDNTNNPTTKNNQSGVNVQNNNSVNADPVEGPGIINKKQSTANSSIRGSNQTLNNTSSKKVDNTNGESGRKGNLDNNDGNALALKNNENPSAKSSTEKESINNSNETDIKNDNNLVESEDNPEYNFTKNPTDSLTSSTTEALKLKISDSLKQVQENKEELEKLLNLKTQDSIKKEQSFTSITLFTGMSAGDLQSSDSRIDPILNNNDTQQKIKLNYGAMFNLNINTDLRFSIRLGVLYQQYQTNINNVEPFTTLRYVNVKPGVNELNAFFSSGSNFRIEQSYSYFLIPLEIRYDLLKDSSLLGVIGSVNYSILNDNKVELLNGNNNALELGTSSLAENEISLGAGLGFRPKLSDRLFLNIDGLLYYQPFRFNDQTFGSDIEVQFRVGLEYRLKL